MRELYNMNQVIAKNNNTPMSFYWTVVDPKDDTKYQMLMPWLTCKDYLMDFFYRGYGSCKSGSVQKTKETQWYIAITLPDTTLAAFKKNVQKYINPYEEAHGFDLTEVYNDIKDHNKNHYAVIKVPKQWYQDTLTLLSIYFSNLRMIASNGHHTPSKLVERSCNEATYYNNWKRIAKDYPEKASLASDIMEFIDLIHLDPCHILKFFDPAKHDYTGYPKKSTISMHGMCGVFFATSEEYITYYTTEKNKPITTYAFRQFRKDKIEAEQARIKEELRLKQEQEAAAKKAALAVKKKSTTSTKKATTTVVKKKKVTTDVKVQSVQRTTKRPRTKTTT